MIRKKVVVGLSGGVDSAVVAALLVSAGYDVTGVFLECWPPDAKAMGGKCRADEDRKDALSVALKLKIPFKVLDFRKQYKKTVVDYFYDEYKAGRTPNPDVMCNKEIKFGLFYDWAMKNDFDFVATGHYARIVRNTRKTQRTRLSDDQIIRDSDPPTLRPSEFSEFSGYNLCIPEDKHKDQTYFLYRLRLEQLEHILFPLADVTKVEVRKEAKKRGLPVADKPDSQGICFIGEVNIQEFLRQRLSVKIGEVVDTKGQVVGEHDGVWFYTVGQRHGFRTSGGRPPLYVIEKNVKNNRLVVGFGSETYTTEFKIDDIHWMQQPKTKKLLVRIRHLGKLVECSLEDGWVELSEPQRGVAPGQSAVFYDRNVVLGGGIVD